MSFLLKMSWHVLACMFIITVVNSNGPDFSMLVLHHMQLVPYLILFCFFSPMALRQLQYGTGGDCLRAERI